MLTVVLTVLVIVDVRVDEVGGVVTVEVNVLDPVVKSHPVYAPDWNNRIARLSTPAVVSHFVNGLPPVESLRIPSALHCTVPNDDSTYGVISTTIAFKCAIAALHSA